jgi:acyl carrier protein
MLNQTALSTQDRVADIVRQILERRAVRKPAALGDDLRAIGLSSLDMVNLMLAVEAEFDLKIPEGEMTPQNFRSIAAIDALVTTLSGSDLAASA